VSAPEQLTFEDSRHVPLPRLTAGYAALAAAPTESGRLRAIVRRLERGGVRETPDAAELDTDLGLIGDAWSRSRSRDRNMQLTVMRHDVATLIANGQPLTLFGDNLFVDLDIGASNLPPGTRLRIGECIVEVTPEPHTGCKLFKQRFGFDALRFTALQELSGHNLRGIHLFVVEPGSVRVGDTIDVFSRP